MATPSTEQALEQARNAAALAKQAAELAEQTEAVPLFA